MLTLTVDPINGEALRRECALHTAGALVIFEGVVRDYSQGRSVTRLEYEAKAALANAEYELIIQDAARRYPVLWTRCVHRIGMANPGETAIWLGVACGHRAEAFDACRYIIDEIKARLPVWKKEYYTDGESDWINAP
jgi:molybdopterin synthase catalytic subunit